MVMPFLAEAGLNEVPIDGMSNMFIPNFAIALEYQREKLHRYGESTI